MHNHRSSLRFTLVRMLLLGVATALPFVAQARSEQRIALVIGNSSYASAPLKNPQNDARDMAGKLRELGFEVIVRENLHIREIGGALREFRTRLVPGSEALFFYAGHGLQVKGINYLPAVDADIRTEEDLPFQALNVNQVLEIMDEARTRLNLVFLDACRNNPYSRRFRSTAGGLAKVSAPSGTLISFATRPGSVAADGEGRNGLFTEHLLQQMDQANVPIESVLKRVVSGVKLASAGQQEPWLEGSIEGEFFFRVAAAPVAAAALVPQPAGLPVAGAAPATARVTMVPVAASDEDALWLAVERGNASHDYAAYLESHPGGRYALLARARIDNLEREAKQAQQRRERAVAAWEVAAAKNNEAAYRDYLAAHPDGPHAPLAQARLRRQREVSGEVVAEPLAAIPTTLAMAPPPSTPASPLAITALTTPPPVEPATDVAAEELLWEEARQRGDSRTLLAYLKRYPAGVHAGAAQELLDTARLNAQARIGKRFRDCRDCPELVIVPAGRFTMGSADKSVRFFSSSEAPARAVSIARPFALGRFELTAAEWDACVAALACAHQTADKGWGRGKRPVTEVSWDDAQQYLGWLSKKTGQRYRLPSEAEWEYAARAGSTTSRHWGEALGQGLANCDGCGSAFDDKKTAPVGSFPANAFGLHDMLGNVWEWTGDCYAKNYDGAPADGSARQDGKCGVRVLRGGGFSDKEKYLRSAARRDEDRDDREIGFGFRVLRELSGSKAEIAAR